MNIDWSNGRWRILSAGECAIVGVATSLAFLFAPGKELAGYWILALSIALFLVAAWRAPRREMSSEVFALVITLPLGLHVLIGLEQLVRALLHDGFQGFFVNSNLRVHVSVGVKNLSVACTLLAALGHYLARQSTALRALGYAAIALAAATLGLLNSMIGISTYFLLVALDLAIASAREGPSPVVRVHRGPGAILVPAIAGILALLLTFPLSGGLVRIQQMQASLSAGAQMEVHKSWMEPGQFVQEFCHDPKQECAVNASVYYRTSWTVFGLQTMLEHPWGLGNVDRALEAAIRLKYPEKSDGHPDDFHNELIEFGVRFGWVPLLLLICGAAWVLVRMYSAARAGSAAASFALGFFVVALVRLATDSVGVGGLALAMTMLCILPCVALGCGRAK